MDLGSILSCLRTQRLAVLVALLTLLPWTARNMLVLGSPIWAATTSISQNLARFASLAADPIQRRRFPEIGSCLLTLIAVLGFADTKALSKQNREVFWNLAIPLSGAVDQLRHESLLQNLPHAIAVGCLSVFNTL